MTHAKFTPKPHQEEAYDFWVKNNGRGINADAPGLGKTLSSILYFDRQKVWPVLVVCPASVKGHWRQEFMDWTGKESVLVEGRALYEGQVQEPVTIINYQILMDQLPWLLEQQYAAVVFDECHSVSSMDTQWTKAAMAIGRRCVRVQGLSGTPIANRPRDFYPMLHLIKPDLFPSFHDYAWKYCSPRFNPAYGGWDYSGASNIDELHEAIKPFTIRRKKDILNLPKQHIKMEMVPIDNEDDYRVIHNQYVGAAGIKFRAYTNAGTAKLTLTTKLLMATARGKARACVKRIQEILADPKEKLIVFATHTAMVDVVYRRAAPGQALRIDGSVPSKKRTKIIDQFQTDPNIRLIVCNIKAAGAGITLTAATKTLFIELPWTPKDVEQARDRNYRIGQNYETEVVYLIAEGTIEKKLCEILQSKSNISDTIIDGKPQNSMNVMDMLAAAVLEK